jgi:hypothetical protein
MKFTIYDLRFTMGRGKHELSGSAGILPAWDAARNPETRRQDAGAPGEEPFSILHSAFRTPHFQ